MKEINWSLNKLLYLFVGEHNQIMIKLEFAMIKNTTSTTGLHLVSAQAKTPT